MLRCLVINPRVAVLILTLTTFPLYFILLISEKIGIVQKLRQTGTAIYISGIEGSPFQGLSKG
ncbi:MAG: hypothetical protein C0407_14685 [Desulfobacca sp.]|nr:hypothetical protein [Desulfobacca sp.]